MRVKVTVIYGLTIFLDNYILALNKMISFRYFQLNRTTIFFSYMHFTVSQKFRKK